MLFSFAQEYLMVYSTTSYFRLWITFLHCVVYDLVALCFCHSGSFGFFHWEGLNVALFKLFAECFNGNGVWSADQPEWFSCFIFIVYTKSVVNIVKARCIVCIKGKFHQFLIKILTLNFRLYISSMFHSRSFLCSINRFDNVIKP